MVVVPDTMLVEADGPVSEHEEARPPLKILIADDELVNRMLLSAILNKDGHTVVEATNGEESVAVFVREQPDMVLMDVMMPVMNGYEAAHRIKQEAGERFVPMIFLTALSDEASLVRCIESGGDDFLTKPYYAVREKALAALQEGHICISLTHTPLEKGGKLVMRVVDSGSGFEHRFAVAALATNTTYSGRGIPLLRSLCNEITYHGAGNDVEAVYVWQ